MGCNVLIALFLYYVVFKRHMYVLNKSKKQNHYNYVHVSPKKFDTYIISICNLNFLKKFFWQETSAAHWENEGENPLTVKADWKIC